ncbi:ribosomal protein S18-alanine N-acetyltransferase [Acetonema longum]|uniref:Ribosomal-protein-alanine acetyltransferase n=1 Tax=Acetonema longum DSM 6540 TaxID=1009370 RepID=F7NI49_9FIRM|nr:ribosomal protein S18-alanine N-acetyltransferase [Acetonema longum]EGO64281.1 ribosomal-protein-alanine acetyltransferase [Acetonema longum DSM 6540]
MGEETGQREAGLIFRWMGLDDIDVIVTLEQACFSTPWSRATFEEELNYNDLAHYLIAEWQGHIVGYAGIWVVCNEAHVMNVAIAPAYQGKGWGRRMMLALICRAQILGAESMTLEVRVSNQTARSLYAKMGFVEYGIRPGYYSEPKEDALLLWLKSFEQLRL